LNRLHPVTRSAGDILPHGLVQLVDVIPYGIVPAARRAAQGNSASTDPEFDFFAAKFALHENLKSRTNQGTEKYRKTFLPQKSARSTRKGGLKLL
jgi:hypothetical protein